MLILLALWVLIMILLGWFLYPKDVDLTYWQIMRLGLSFLFIKTTFDTLWELVFS